MCLTFLVSKILGFLVESQPTSPFTQGCLIWKTQRHSCDVSVVNNFPSVFTHLICFMIIFMQSFKLLCSCFYQSFYSIWDLCGSQKNLYYLDGMMVKVAQLCLTLCHLEDCSSSDSSVHGNLQARILEFVAIPFSSGIFPTLGLNWSLLHCRQILCSLRHQGDLYNNAAMFFSSIL